MSWSIEKGIANDLRELSALMVSVANKMDCVEDRDYKMHADELKGAANYIQEWSNEIVKELKN